VVDRHPGGAQATDDHPLLGQVAGDLEIAFVRVARRTHPTSPGVGGSAADHRSEVPRPVMPAAQRRYGAVPFGFHRPAAHA
jgi:hypothetical protein